MIRLACDRCGKRYAVQGEPAPGRKYRVTCKGCGQILLFTGGEPASPSAPEPAAAPQPPATAGPALPPRAPGPDAPGARPVAGAARPTVPVDPPAPAPARAAGSYFIDIFGDGELDGAPAPADSPTDDPPPRELGRFELPSGPPWPVPSSARAGAEPSEADEPAEVRPERRVLRRLVAGVATAWVLMLAGAFGVWLWRRSHPPAPAASAASIESSATPRAPAPAPPPAHDPTGESSRPEPAAPPASTSPDGAVEASAAAAESPAPPAASSAEAPEVSPPPAPPASRPEKRPARPAPARPVVRKPAARPERRAAAPASPARTVNTSPATQPAAPEPLAAQPTGLTDQEIQRVLGGARRAFQACVRDPSRGLPEPLGARQVTLRFNVSPGGEVSYPTIDDVTISSAPVGQCLKSAARSLVFPAFRGDPIRVDAPVSIPAR